MNSILKRTLATAAIAPLALIASVGPAQAGHGGVEYGDVSANLAGANDEQVFTCTSDRDPRLEFRVLLDMEGDPGDTDYNDVQSAVVRGRDMDWDDADGDTYDIADQLINLKSVKLEYFDETAEWDDSPRRLEKQTRHIRRGAKGVVWFSHGEKAVGWVRATATWYRPIDDEDADGHKLRCLYELD